MSDRVAQSSSDCDGRTGKSVHSVQSVWMAHWTRTSYNSAAETHNLAPNALANKENDQDSKPLKSVVKLETMSKLSKSVKRLRESETQTFEVINESLRTSSRTIAKETLGNWSLPLHNPRENVKTPFQDPLDCVKTQSYDVGCSTLASRPSLDNPSHLASHLVPYGDPGQYITKEGERTQKPVINRSFLAAKEELPRLATLEHEHGRSITPYLRQKNTFLLDRPSTSRNLPPEFGGEEFQKIPGLSFIRLLKDEPSPSQVPDQQKLPHPLHDIEIMRTRNTMDPVEGMTGYCPGISQTTHSMLITKGTDANLLEGNNVIANSRMWSEINAKASLSNRDSPSKSFGRYKGGMKLQIQSCSTGSERKKSIEGSKPSQFVLKNESSAETDTMDMDVLQEKNQLCGTSSSIVKKVNKMNRNSPPRLALDFPRKETGRKQFKLDINLELPAPTDNMEASSSRTESLDLGSILARAEQPSSSRTDLCAEGLPGQDPSNRWVKRLKVGAPVSMAFGTRSSRLVGETSPEKSHEFPSKITEPAITSSELASCKLHGKELMAPDNTPGLAMNSSPSSMSVIKKDLDSLTSHCWIQRLLHERTTTSAKRPQPVVVCEPQTSKLELDDFQKKQLPSLGAMALMGKAMNGFQPCEFRRKGPLVVWNTRSF
ncbi:putative glucose-1-phosphate adenylyltransferase large subunit 1-like isoform X1 [Capsicum annuum]|nr:putative glucose-1-phosphate adenylyltransferase large subunit 1-like isoform X1 [Capsicum annuum]